MTPFRIELHWHVAASQRLFNHILVNTQVLNLNVFNTYPPGMAPSISSPQSTEGIGHGVIRGESDSEQQRCASLSHAYQLVSKDCLQETVHILRRSTSSTTIHSLTYFLSIDRPS
jgi:hypothetical protein